MSIQKPLAAILLGKPMEVQLAPFGDYPGTLDGKRVVQVCDKAAFMDVVANFVPDQRILVDFEHDAKDTTAAGWIRSVRVDPEDGLIGSVEFTDVGAETVNAKRILFISADWDLDLTTHRPIRLRTAGLTNRPNIPVRPILNKATQENSIVEGEGQTKMTETAKLLGLDPETATDAECAAAVKALQDQLAEKAAEALTAEAEAAAKENEARIENKADFIAAFIENPALTRKMLKAIKRPEADKAKTARVVNKEDAAPPSFATRKDDVLAIYESLSGEEKAAYLAANANAIVEARKRKAEAEAQ